MGGKAASNLIPKLIANGASESLKFSKIASDDMGSLFNEVVRPILSELSGAGLLDPEYKSEFGLGSTRLAALAAGEKVKLLPSEDKKTISKALRSKETYGDLDIDVVLRDGVSIKEVGEYLESHYPDTIAYRAGRDEINLAYVWDGNNVIQIDLVDVTGDKKNRLEFEQSSSIVDIASGVKGAIQTILLRAVLATKEMTQAEKQQVRDAIETHPEIEKWISKGYDFKVPGVDKAARVGRWQLGGNGIGLVVDLFKPGRKEGAVTKKTIKLTDEPSADFSDVDNIVDAIIPGASLDTINSAVRLAKAFKAKYPGKVQELWDEFSDNMERHKDGMDEEEYKNGMNTLAKILDVGE